MSTRDSITNSSISDKSEASNAPVKNNTGNLWNALSDLPEIIILTDSKLKVLKTNRATGSFSVLEGSSLSNLVSSKTLEGVRKGQEQLVNSSQASAFDFKLKAGSALYKALMVVKSAGSSDEQLNYLITLREAEVQATTEVKDAETGYQPIPKRPKEQPANEARLAMAMKIAKIAYWEIDLDTDEFIFNDEFYALFHTNAKDVGSYRLSREKYLEYFVHPEDRALIVNEIIASRENPDASGSYELQHRMLYADGTQGYMAVRIKILRDKNGNVLSVVGANQDITDQHLAEEALRNSEAQLNNAMKIAKLGHWEYDVASNNFYFNDQFYSLFRSSVKHVGSYKMTPEAYAKRFLHPDDQYLVAQETAEALTTDDPNYSKQVEHRIIREDGTTGYLQVRLFVRKDSKGKTIKTFGANQDITEHIEIENRLREQNKKYIALNEKLKESLEQVQKMNTELEVAKLKAEESDKLKSAFLANISHEIRTPMNGIIGFSKLLVRPTIDEERKKQYSLIVNDMCRQLLHLIDDIIDISKIETGQVNIHKSGVDLNNLMLRLYSIYKPHVESRSITLNLVKGNNENEELLETDNTKLRQIFQNLLNNALKFTRDGQITYGYEWMDKQVRFFVKDTGIGIASEQKDFIFERFGQADNEPTKSYGGTGLGLAIAKAYVEKLGGSIWYESEVNKGTIFYFTLPKNQDSGDESTAAFNVIPSNSAGEPTILIVEDEDVNYFFLEEVLTDENLKLLHAKNGKQAVEICKQHPEIDLVLMDIKLPDISGYEAYRRILEIRPTLPALAQTAYALVGDQEEAIRHGFADYIPKPIDENILLRKINELLKRQ